MTTTQPAPPQPPIAVVIIGRNEGERLRACLNSVLAMNYPRNLVEVLYVDSSSTDSSVALARSLGVKTILLDGDTLLHPDFVPSALAHFADPVHTQPLAGVYGNRRETRTADSIYNALFDLDWNAGTGYSLFFGGDALVRRDALAAVGGYNPLLIAGEEPDLCRRMRGLGYRILHVDEPMTLHDLAMFTLGQYWRRSVRTGYAYAEISSKYAHTDDPLWSAESRSNITRGLFWLSGPVLAIVLSLLVHSVAPLALFLVAAFILFARTAARAGRKTRSLKLLLAYSLHSHLQQIPILFGQIRYQRQSRRGGDAAIIEYKSNP